MFPHGGDGQRDLFVALVGVVENVHCEWLVRAISRFGQQGFGLLDPLLFALQLAGRFFQFKTVHNGGREAICGNLSLSQDLVGDGLPVDGERERLAYFRVIERFALGVEDIVIAG